MKLKDFTTKMWLILLAMIPTSLLAQTSFTNVTSELTDPTKYSGVAMCIQDMNGDRLDDIVCLDNARNLYIEYQNLDGTWTSYDGPEMDGGNAWGMTAGDVDNNGYGDVFSGLFGGRPDYAQANANGTSWSVSELPTYSLATQAVTLSDFDHDGDLDFFSCGDTGPSGIWENDGNGNFTYSGDDLVKMSPTDNPGWGPWDGSGNYGSTATDYDLDGDTDFYITHCRQGISNSADPKRINQMFINDGTGSFTEDFTNNNGLRLGAQCWTTDFQDVDNDGDFDAFVTNHDVDNMLLINENNVFTNDIFESSGLDMSVGTPIQGIMRDFDNDMYVDIIVTGSDYAYYRNNGDLTFSKINGIFGNNDMESLAVGDLNHDGFLDVYGGYANIYTTPSNTPDAVWMNDGNDNNWIAVNLQGTISNRSAVGAVVRLYGPWGMQVREVRAGELYGVTNSLQQHFGLAQNTAIDSVVVDWPVSGIHQVVSNPSPNQFLTIIENQCVAPEAVITSNGPTVLCSGETLQLDAPTGTGYTYEWSTGATTPSINVSTPGNYMVHVWDNNGCDAVSPAVLIEVSPDETPEVSVTGDLEFCQGGSVMLTSTQAQSYTWSNQETSQSITVSQSGNYYVTIEGACDDFTSTTVAVNVLDAPAPTSNDVTIPTAGTADLTAAGSGTDFNWYDQATGGNYLGSGANWTSPVVTTNTTFYVEEVHTFGGGTTYGAKTDNSTGGTYHNVTGYYNEFDVHANCSLESVKVYTEAAGDRTAYIETSGGTLVHSQTFTIPEGESRIYFTDWDLTPGTDYRFRVLEADHGLWRDNNTNAVNFPYTVGSLVTITGANVSNQQYYYYYYDWEVEAESMDCISDRTPVTVFVNPVGVAESELADKISAYPNPTDGLLTIEFSSAIEGQVALSVLDVAGKQVQTSTLSAVTAGQRTNMQLSSLAKGTYFVSITTNVGNWTQRISVK